MKSSKAVIEGLALAAGVFIGNSIFVPMISGGGVVRGFITGFVAAALVLVIYNIIALYQSDKA